MGGLSKSTVANMNEISENSKQTFPLTCQPTLGQRSNTNTTVRKHLCHINTLIATPRNPVGNQRILSTKAQQADTRRVCSYSRDGEKRGVGSGTSLCTLLRRWWGSFVCLASPFPALAPRERPVREPAEEWRSPEGLCDRRLGRDDDGRRWFPPSARQTSHAKSMEIL